MPGGQARMIQMLATLSDIQQRRRQQDLAEAQFEDSKRVGAEQMGFNVKSREYKQVADLLDAIARSSTESRGALTTLGKSLGLPDAEVAALTQYGQNAPESLDVMRQRAAGAGYAAMAPDQRATTNAEASSVATTGMNQGTIASSQLARTIDTGAQGMVTPGMQQQAAQRAANPQQNLLEALVTGVIAQDPKMVKKMAGSMAGTDMSVAQAGQQAIGAREAGAAEGQVAASFYRTNADILYQAGETAAKLASAKALGGLTPQNIIEGTNSLTSMIVAIGKEKNEASRNQLMAQYNNLARSINPALVASDPNELPDRASVIERIKATIVPPGYSPMQPQGAGQPQMFQPSPTFAPQQPTPPFMNTPQPQFLQPTSPFRP